MSAETAEDCWICPDTEVFLLDSGHVGTAVSYYQGYWWVKIPMLGWAEWVPEEMLRPAALVRGEWT